MLVVRPQSRWRANVRALRRRRGCLRRLAADNERRCWRLPLYGEDLRDALAASSPPPPAALRVPTLEELLVRALRARDRLGVCAGGARAATVELVAGAGVAAAEWRARTARVESAACSALRPLLPYTSAAADIAFPHPRLLQYDCGTFVEISFRFISIDIGFFK